MDIWFWRAASRPVWERIRATPDDYDALIGAKWKFEPVEGRERARMFVDTPAPDLRNDSSWTGLYAWFAARIATLYQDVAPKLRQELDQSEGSPATA